MLATVQIPTAQFASVINIVKTVCPETVISSIQMLAIPSQAPFQAPLNALSQTPFKIIGGPESAQSLHQSIQDT